MGLQWQFMQQCKYHERAVTLAPLEEELARFQGKNQAVVEALDEDKRRENQAARWKTTKGILQVKNGAASSRGA